MSSKPPIYPPPLDPALSKAFTRIGDAVKEVVRRGWEEIELYALSSPSPENDILVLLHRHVLECIDGVAVLVTEGCADTTKPLLRSAVEAVWAIEYILEADSVRRARAYRVDYSNRQIKKVEEIRGPLPHPPSSTAGTPPDPVVQEVARVRNLLQVPPLDQVNTEWHGQVHGRRLPNWFSLFSGPSSIFQLADHLGRKDWYKTLYAPWSGFIHAGSLLDNIDLSGGTLPGPRQPELIQQLASLAMSFGITATRRMVEHFAPARKADLRSWYSRIKPEYDLIGDGKIIRVP